MVATPLVYDPYDYAIDADPHPVWKRLRDEAPVYYNEQHDFYALSRFDDVLAGAPRPDDVQLGAHDRARDDGARSRTQFMTSMMIFMDPPEHTRYRKLVSRAFTPRHIAALEAARPRRCARGSSTSSSAPAAFDYVADFGARLPGDGHLRAARRARGGRGRSCASGPTRCCTSIRARCMGRHAIEHPQAIARLLAGASSTTGGGTRATTS